MKTEHFVQLLQSSVGEIDFIHISGQNGRTFLPGNRHEKLLAQIKVENPGFLYPNISKMHFLTVMGTEWDRHYI